MDYRQIAKTVKIAVIAKLDYKKVSHNNELLFLSHLSIYLLYKQKLSNRASSPGLRAPGLSNNRIKSWLATAHTTYPYLLYCLTRYSMNRRN